jgi:uncharacterized lipoprotein YbaY
MIGMKAKPGSISSSSRDAQVGRLYFCVALFRDERIHQAVRFHLENQAEFLQPWGMMNRNPCIHPESSQGPGEKRMFAKKVAAICLLVLMTLLSACGGAQQAAVTGVIDHPHSMTFPVGTVISVLLLDTTKEGSEGKKIAEQVIKDRDISIPMPFVLTYDPGKINQDHHYHIRVQIKDSSGAVRYASEKDVPVITQGNPRIDIDVFVDLVNR